MFFDPVLLSQIQFAWDIAWPILLPAFTDGASSFIGLFLLSHLGIATSLYPMIVPYPLTLWDAASPPRTQAFLLVGTLFLLAVVLTYPGWPYWVFRRKVRAPTSDTTRWKGRMA
ncbi:cytochrome d ubiquinol oxidase subunit II [Bradyrhizobium sp. AS23.2]|uniref:cytochrome d ubiquinol oxidase subunit II n=1 Tax=Bradyrhizobium sp. AS23.2 TaxID=1680155 RepID=UPI00093CD808|nr:cytochrome d ubiquinol oxidase subunit II [Bradyrhizobium sp. AS23.2]OKO76016.1 hypothetical protein AC630_23490 [Bradyrhizobium sp. AS23.2]